MLLAYSGKIYCIKFRNVVVGTRNYTNCIAAIKCIQFYMGAVLAMQLGLFRLLFYSYSRNQPEKYNIIII